MTIKSLRVGTITPSPFQCRKHFPETKIRELAKSIERDGLIEPVVVRKNGKGWELIAGERRLRAVSEHTDSKTILCRIVEATDLQARRMCAAENLQRQDLSDVESVEAIVEMVDAELIEDSEYAAMGKGSVSRVAKLLGRLESVEATTRNKNRGPEKVKDSARELYNKFIVQIRSAFESLPRPTAWESFYNNDLPLVTKIDPTVRQWAIANNLNKSQTKALDKLKREAPEAFQKVSETQSEDGELDASSLLPSWERTDEPVSLRELSSRDISAATSMAHRERAQRELAEITNRRAKPVKGLYDVIVIDPPWPMEKIEREVRPNQESFDYPTMSEDELGDLTIPADEDCHIWVWTTHKFMPMALRLLDAWALKYVCCFVWNKPGGFQPIGLPQYNTEFALYARKGAPKFADTKKFNTGFSAKRGKHSEKPEEFYELVRRVTSGRRLDMFNRRDIEGFDRWGNEA